MSWSRILEASALAGQIILESGGEISRVEDTVGRICAAFGAADCQSFATPTALIISVTDRGGQGYSTMRRIRSRSIDLGKVEAVNTISRSCSVQCPSVDRLEAELREIRLRKPCRVPLAVLFSALATGSLAIVFQGDFRDMACAFLTGGLIRLAVLGLGRLSLNDFFVNAIGGAVATLSAWWLTRLGLGSHREIIAIASLMLLVPGLAITNALRDITSGDYLSGGVRITEAFLVALGVACGTGLAYKLLGLGGGLPL